MLKYTFVINPNFNQLTDLIHQIPSSFDVMGELIYDGRNKVRKEYTQEGSAIVIKRFKIPNIIQRIGYLVRPSKAKRAYEIAMRLLQLGIDTPEPIAYIESRNFGLLKYGYFISTEKKHIPCIGMLDEFGGVIPEGLPQAVAEFIVEMHKKGFMHGDINLANILYRQNDNGTFDFTVIDTNRSHFIDNPTKEDCLKNLMRLTHERPLARDIISRYARLRGWDADSSVDYVFQLISAFERRRALKYKILMRKKK
ncbi:MAG: lipopolysaccharide kinase InaA family protein [Bacteroidales bacterium]|nr:lipopolysaccharide kinase InaA family protein [Bacteroidales bacterium]